MGKLSAAGNAARSAVVWLRSSRRSLIRIEGVAGWSSGGAPTSRSVRPSVLAGWEGRGAALRIVAHPGRGNSLKILMAGSGCQRSATSGDRYRGILDIQWEWSPEPHWRCRLRRRRETKQQWTWSPRFPWLPPTSEIPQVVASTVVSIIREESWGRTQVDLRTRDAWGGSHEESRYLISGKFQWQASAQWSCRGGWGLAWGEGGDLVSAVSPLQGYVVPRHWGHWNEQWFMGVGRELSSWQIQAGMARRDPVPLSEHEAWSFEGWCEASLSW